MGGTAGTVGLAPLLSTDCLTDSRFPPPLFLSVRTPFGVHQLCEPRDCVVSNAFGLCYVTDRAGVFAINLQSHVVRLITGGAWGRGNSTQWHARVPADHGSDGQDGSGEPADARLVGHRDGELRDALFDHPDGIEFDEERAVLYACLVLSARHPSARPAVAHRRGM